MSNQLTTSNEPVRTTERKYLTVLFSDLSDSTALAASVDAERFADFLQDVILCFERIIPRHGGTISQIRGDGVFALFGLDAREDEGRRATEAALELHEAVKNLSFTTSEPGFTYPTLHSGIHSGLVLPLEGDTVLGRYILVGEAANLASRLADEASADEILVSEESLGVDLSFFDLGASSDRQLKGRTEPLTVYTVQGRSQINTRFEARQHRGLAPIIGREREFNLLNNHLASVKDTNELRMVALVGSGGMGKTRLIEDFLSHIDVTPATKILRGYSESYLDSEPLQPILQMWRHFFGLRASAPGGLSNTVIADVVERCVSQNSLLLSEHLSTFKDLLIPSMSKENITEVAVIEATQALFESLVNRDDPGAPFDSLVLFFDDWQWVDDATRRIVQSLSKLSNQPIFVIFASRDPLPTFEVANALIQLELQQLTRVHTLRLIEKLVPDVDSYIAQLIEQDSGGNPLYLEELCHSITRLGVNQWNAQRIDSSQVPNHLHGLIESRIASLSARNRELVRSAAVIGNVVPMWLLVYLTGLLQDDEAFKQLAELDVLFPDQSHQSLRFKHGITREVVLNSIGLDERRQMHRNVALAVERHYPSTQREEFLELLAYNHREGANFEQAAAYATAAGDKAMKTAAVDRAYPQYQNALTAIDQLEWDTQTYQQWMGIAQKLAFSCLYDARHDLIPTYQRAVNLARERNDIASMVDAQYWLAYVCYALGEARTALEYGEHLLKLVPEMENRAQAAQYSATFGLIAGAACEYEASLNAYNEALPLQRPYKTKPRVSYAFAYSLSTKAMVHGDKGDFELAYQCFDEAQEVLAEQVHQTQSSVSSMRSAVYLWQGRWQEAQEYAERTVMYAEQMGSRYVVAVASAQHAYARYRLNDHSAIDDLIRTMGWLNTYDQALWTSLHHAWLCELLVEDEQYESARVAALHALQRARKMERLGESVTYCALAAIPTGDYNRHSPEHYLNQARRSATKRQSRRERAMIDFREAQLQLSLGDQGSFASQGHASELLVTCQQDFSELGMYWYSAQAQKLYRP